MHENQISIPRVDTLPVPSQPHRMSSDHLVVARADKGELHHCAELSACVC